MMKFFIICCPVGPYYPTGFKPISLLADDKNVRAWPGGVGSSKVGGNYGPTIKPFFDAAQTHKVDQVGHANTLLVILMLL